MKGQREGGKKGNDRSRGRRGQEGGGWRRCMTVQTCVPYLGLDYFGINFNASGSKLHSNGRL